MNFDDFNLDQKLLLAIKEIGFQRPSEIQQIAIDPILQGFDIVAQAHTGTGKTAAFALPILNKITNTKQAEALIIVPTRELAMQVSDEVYRFGKFLDIKTATIYGGGSYESQLKRIKNSSIIVATPGRLLDLLSSDKIKLNPKFVVLDEADEMLDMGFLDDIKAIFEFFHNKKQTLLFSATMPETIKKLAKSILSNPKFISVTQKQVSNKNIKQSFYVVRESEKNAALIRLLDFKNPKKSIIFCRTKKDVDTLGMFLNSQGYNARSLHGDMEQKKREETIRAFKRSSVDILVATDVAARGLDVEDISHVFNYHLPFDSESYVHRIGRTARAGKEGMAISIVNEFEFKTLLKIEKNIGSLIEPKSVPNIEKVKQKKIYDLIELIKSTEIKKSTISLLSTLLEEYDLQTTALKLLSLLQNDTFVKGEDHIGKSSKQIQKLLNLTKEQIEFEKKSKNRIRRNKNRRKIHDKII